MNAGTVGELYELCLPWKENNFSMKNLSQGDDITTAYCMGYLTAWSAIGVLNCEAQRLDQGGLINFTGAFEDTELKQMVMALLNYAEKYPGRWNEHLFAFQGAMVVASQELSCRD